MTWKELSKAAPDLAEAGRTQIFQYGVGLAFLATVRKDGGPRLHPVCPVLSEGHLYLLITRASPKRHDLARDGRYALQAFAQPRAGSDEFYLEGTALEVSDATIRRRVLRDARHVAQESEMVFELMIERAMQTR